MKQILFLAIFAVLLAMHIFPSGMNTVLGYGIIYGAIVVVISQQIASKEILRKNIPGILLLIIIFIYALAGIVYNQLTGTVSIPLTNHLKSLKWFIFDPLILYFCMFLLIGNVKEARRLLAIAVSVFVILNIVSLILLPFDVSVFRAPDQVQIQVQQERFIGIFTNANQMAYFMCFLIPYIYYFHKTSSKQVVKIICMVAIFASVISILMSGSRGGILSLFFTLLALMVILKEYKISAIAIIFIALFMAVAVVSEKAVFLSHTFERLSVLISGDLEKASAGRLDIWRGLYKIFVSDGLYMIVGRGLGTTSELLLKYAKIRASGHNWYFIVILEFGIIGSVLWFLLINRILCFVNKFVATKEDPYLRKVILLSLFVIAFSCCFTALYFIRNFIALIFGIAFSYLYHEKQVNETGPCETCSSVMR